MKLPVLAFVLMLSSWAFAFDAKSWHLETAQYEKSIATLKMKHEQLCVFTNEPATDISIPIEAYPSGAVKTLLKAKSARFQPDSDYVWGEKVKVVQFAENGTTQAVVNASTCVVDRKTKQAWCQGLADATYENNFLEGEKVFLSMEKRFMHIFTDAYIRVKDVKLDSGKKGEISLESKSAIYDQHNGVVMLDKDVKVFETDRTLWCDKAYAFVEGTNNLKKVVAVGNVKFSDGKHTGSCPIAVYDKTEAKIEMFSSEKKVPVIEESGSSKWKLEGEKIVFWLESEQIEIEKSVITASDVDKNNLNLEGLKK
jgi:lipopolysaccharide export system protein LptA